MSFLDSREKLSPYGIGKSVPRREDKRLLTGRGRYAADFSLPDQAYAYLVHSPHAHARVAMIDTAASSGMPGVLAVLTGSDAAADGLKPIPHSPVSTNPHEVPLQSRDGAAFFIAPHPVLAVDAVRYVGEPVALVVAETLAQAMDAAERVDMVLNRCLQSPGHRMGCRPERRLSGSSTARTCVLTRKPATRRRQRRRLRARRSSAIISTRSRGLSLNRRYQRTHRMMTSRSKWRPSNSSATVPAHRRASSSVPHANVADRTPLFAPEPQWRTGSPHRG